MVHTVYVLLLKALEAKTSETVWSDIVREVFDFCATVVMESSSNGSSSSHSECMNSVTRQLGGHELLVSG